MARPKKKPEYNKDTLQIQLIDTVVEAYQNPVKDTGDANGHMCLNLLADEFGMTPIKIRKILITAGAYETPVSRQVNDLYKEGKSVTEICKLMNLSVASVNGYLPYKKAVYKMEERTLLAERLVRYRWRKEASDKLKCSIENAKIEEQRIQFREALAAFAGYRFQTSEGVRFDYKIESERMCFTGEESYPETEILEMITDQREIQDERVEVILKRIGGIREG